MFYTIRIKIDGDGEFKVTHMGKNITKKAFYGLWSIGPKFISGEKNLLKDMTLSFTNGHIAPQSAKAFYTVLRKIRKYSGTDFEIALTIYEEVYKPCLYFFKRKVMVVKDRVLYKVTASERHAVKAVYSGDENRIIAVT